MDYFASAYFDGSYFDVEESVPEPSPSGGPVIRRRPMRRVVPPVIQQPRDEFEDHFTLFM